MRLGSTQTPANVGPTRVAGPALGAFGYSLLVFRGPELFCVPLGPWWLLFGAFGLLPGPPRVFFDRAMTRRTQKLLHTPSAKLRRKLGVQAFAAGAISAVKVDVRQRWMKLVVEGRGFRLRSPLASVAVAETAVAAFLGARGRTLIRRSKGWAPPRLLMWALLAFCAYTAWRWFDTEGYVTLDWLWAIVDW